ncbi:modular serine protease [Chelonus insularis]|uniref:modular serine protease n=1 Tax=Chelonus insularis TaxID=460826 RepID=UPI001588FB5E|nr:modular serine protease [Chelonus insularis]
MNSHHYQLILIIVFIRNFSAFQFPDRIQIESCSLDQFRCANGECISSPYLCDGKKNCQDGSDETRNECLKPEIICPKYAFRCNYGACVDGDVVCDGVDDCIDKSDEKQCTGERSKNITTTPLSGCKGTDQFRCENGQCIDDTRVCDGPPDCNDRSDESSTVCGRNECPQYTFRCSYGACVDGNLICNGVRNCADGSDEEPFINCRNNTNNKDTQTISINNSISNNTPEKVGTTTLSPLFTKNPLRKPCLRPNQPANGEWKLHKSQCYDNGDDHCSINNNITSMEPGTFLVYTCNFGYKLNSLGDVFCGPEGKWSSEPKCIEIRCKTLSSASTLAECTLNDEWTSCEMPVLPGTTAKVSCKSSYRQDIAVLGLQRDTVRCNSKGQWEPEPIRCIPVCGVRSYTNLKPLIVNGRRPNITEFPWHATLYRSESLSGESEKIFVCGATIIQDDLLITAAHCVYDEVSKKVDNPKRFFITTGNMFRDYDSPLHDSRIVHKRKVKKIYINCNYLGLEGNYARDIAILHVDKPFTFTSFLIPICLDTTTNDQTAIDVGKIGIVAGFGRTNFGQSSGVLQSLSVPVVPLNQCKSASVSSEAEKFITIDKFCAGYVNGSSVCDGDSGGGLAFSDRGLWYLRGIVSVGIGSKVSGGGLRTCDNDLYSLYTKISSHISWIQDVIFKLETHRDIPSCRQYNTR